MLKLTLDANCVINLLDVSSETRASTNELQGLIQYALEAKAVIALTTRVEADFSNDKNDLRRAAMMEMLKLFPVVPAVGRFDTSRWDADVFAGAEHVALTAEVRGVVFPGLTEEDRRYKNKINDIDHLVSHKFNGRDVFVTNDSDILKRSDALRQLGILVMSPAGAMRFVEEDVARRQHPTVTLVEGYSNPAFEGVVNFDYSNNNGSFVIGSGSFAFETRWSGASSESIHAYHDAPSIDAIAMAWDVAEIADISDASEFDFSSRTRGPLVGQIVIWRNNHGFYAATKIVAIVDRNRNGPADKLIFAYKIASDGSANFA